MKLTIVKVGGAVLEDPGSLNAFLDAFGAVPGYKWLVHGGGRKATQVAEKLGIESVFVEGRRVTSDALLEVVTDVYSGINKQLVARLQQRGIKALGLCGADLMLIPSEQRSPEPVDYGRVGDPVVAEPDTMLIDFLVRRKVTCVFSPLTMDPKHGLLNTNADTIAQTLAKQWASYGQVSLIYAFEMPGVLKDKTDLDSCIATLDKKEIEELKKQGIISDGMIPKLQQACKALEDGITDVRITRYDKLTGGTLITNEHTTV